MTAMTGSAARILAFGAISGHTPTLREPPSGGGLHDRGTRRSFLASRREETKTQSTTALPAVSELVGASEEMGGVFDPLGLATDEVGLAARHD